jgi:hypothetical protein
VGCNPELLRRCALGDREVAQDVTVPRVQSGQSGGQLTLGIACPQRAQQAGVGTADHRVPTERVDQPVVVRAQTVDVATCLHQALGVRPHQPCRESNGTRQHRDPGGDLLDVRAVGRLGQALPGRVTRRAACETLTQVVDPAGQPIALRRRAVDGRGPTGRVGQRFVPGHGRPSSAARASAASTSP